MKTKCIWNGHDIYADEAFDELLCNPDLCKRTQIKEECVDYKRKGNIMQLASPGARFENEDPFFTDLSGFY